MTTHALQPATFGGNNINDGTNYEASFVDDQHGLPAVSAVRVGRAGVWPVVAGITRPGRAFTLRIIIRGADRRVLRRQLSQWFDPEDETAQTLTATLDGTSYKVQAICEALEEETESFGVVWHARLVIDGDVRWRKVTATSDTWNISGDTDTNVVANGGEDDAYPVLTITPTGAKTGYNVYKRWIPIIWRAGVGASRYPVDIVNNSLDTASLISGSKMQADGDDIRVIVDGVETDYWLHDINDATTAVWVNLDFDAQPTVVGLGAAIASGATITTLDADGDISGYPASGILLINSEAFVYTGKSNSLRRFTGVTRAARGTSAANHSAGDDINWVQRDIFMTYGNLSASAWPSDDNYKPAFNLGGALPSTNTSWVYAGEYGEDDGLRAAQWSFVNLSRTEKYTDSQNTDTDPWDLVGIRSAWETYHGRWQLYNPCGITNANSSPSGGEKYASNVGKFEAAVVSSSNGNTWSSRYNIPAPASANNWEAWGNNTALGSNDRYVGLRLFRAGAVVPGTYRVGLSTMVLTLNSNNTPAITVGAEQGNYPLDCILRNNTTGDELHITFEMETGEDLVIDSDEKTVTYDADGSNRFSAVDVRGDVREAWLRLQPGNNELYFEDTGTTGLTIKTDFEERFYG